jgi:hypothetical protein
MPRRCEECGKVHPEDELVEKFGWSWDDLREFKDKKEWPLASKLAALAIELGNECEHQFNRAEFFARDNNSKEGA